MTQNSVLKKFGALPPEAQRQVLDFIAFLETRYRPVKEAKPKINLAKESFVGIWRSRDDLRDSSAWVRNA